MTDVEGGCIVRVMEMIYPRHDWTDWITVVAATDTEPVAIYRRLKFDSHKRYDWRVVRVDVHTYVVTVDNERHARQERKRVLKDYATEKAV